MNLTPALTRNWALKLTALGLAIGLWSVLKAEAPTRIAVPRVPVQVEVRDPAWVPVAPAVPREVTVTFVGPARELLQLAVERPRVLMTIQDVEDSIEVRAIERRFIVLENQLDRSRIEEIRPAAVRLRFERIITRSVPLAIATRGALPTGYTLGGPLRTEPRSVRVSGPTSLVSGLDSLRLPAIDLSTVTDTGSVVFEVPVDTTGLGELTVAPARARVRVPVRTAPPGVEAADGRP